MFHVAQFIHVEIFRAVFREIAVRGNVNPEVFERFHGSPEIYHLVFSPLVRGIHQRVGGEPVASGAYFLNVRLTAEHEQESGSAALLGVTDQCGGMHVTGQRGSASLGVVCGHITERHQQTNGSVKNHPSDLWLLFQGVILVSFATFVFFVSLLSAFVIILVFVILGRVFRVPFLSGFVVLGNTLVHFFQIYQRTVISLLI